MLVQSKRVEQQHGFEKDGNGSNRRYYKSGRPSWKARPAISNPLRYGFHFFPLFFDVDSAGCAKFTLDCGRGDINPVQLNAYIHSDPAFCGPQ